MRGDRGTRLRAALPAALFARLYPIEQAFSKIKAILRGLGTRIRDALVEAIP